LLRSFRALSAASLLLACGSEVSAQAPSVPVGTASGLIVKLKPVAQEGPLQTTAQAQARVGRLSRLSVAAGYTSAMPWRHLTAQTTVLATPSALTPAVQKKLIERLMATGQVEWVEPNVREPLAAPSNSTFNPNQWWLAAWERGKSSSGIPDVMGAWRHSISTNVSTSALAHTTVVGVLDTGMQTHVDLPASQFLPGYDFVSNPSFSGDKLTDGAGGGWDSDATDPGDSVDAAEAGQYDFLKAGCGTQSANSWHGTIVASFIAANGVSVNGAKGVNPSAKILPVRVAGKCGADLADIVAGMYWAAGLTIPSPLQPVPVNPVSNRAQVINISFGGADACGNVYQDAVNALRNAHVSVVAAAGNEHSVVARPGNCAGVIAVAALNRAGFKSTYSNFGSQVAVSTLGGDPGRRPQSGYLDAGAWEAYLGDEGLFNLEPTPEAPSSLSYAYFAGTSYSAPIVSGVISLMLDVNPSLLPDQIEAGLRASARPHVTSNDIGQCSDQNPGRCICTTSTCGAGVVDAYEAVRYALAKRSGQTYIRLTEGSVRLGGDGAIADAILSAKRVASQDRVANVPGSNNSSNATATVGGGGGGGAVGTLELAALLGLSVLAWHLNPRKQ
jgi:serine protease